MGGGAASVLTVNVYTDGGGKIIGCDDGQEKLAKQASMKAAQEAAVQLVDDVRCS